MEKKFFGKMNLKMAFVSKAQKVATFFRKI